MMEWSFFAIIDIFPLCNFLILYIVVYELQTWNSISHGRLYFSKILMVRGTFLEGIILQEFQHDSYYHDNMSQLSPISGPINYLDPAQMTLISISSKIFFHVASVRFF